MRPFLSFFLFIFISLPVGVALSEPSASPNPDQALQRLMDGNGRFVSTKMTHPQQNGERRKALTQGQSPFAVILGCADSRIPPEVIFDQGLGDLFVVRVAGNVLDTMGLGSIEYATQVLGSSLVVVLGHSSCGAVDAAIKNKPLPGHIQNLADHILADLKGANCKKDTKQLDCSIAANVEFIVAQLKNSDPVLAPRVKSGQLKVVGAHYDLESGKVSLLTKE